MVTIFHLGGAVAREKYKATSTVLHAVGTICHRCGHRAGRSDIQYRGTLAGSRPHVGHRCDARVDAAARPGPADAHVAAPSLMAHLRVELCRRKPYWRGNLYRSIPLRLGHPLPHTFHWDGTPRRSRHTFHGICHSSRYQHFLAARRLALLVRHAALPAIPHALLGMGRYRRHPAPLLAFPFA